MITKKEYAKRKNFSLQYLGRMIRELNIRTEGKMIDPVDADKKFKASSDPARAKFRKSSPQNAADQQNDDTEDKEPDSEENVSFSKARAERERYRAKQEKLNYLERVGKLADAAKWEKKNFEVGTSVKDKVLNIPDRVSGPFAAETDQHKIKEILTKELHQALEGLNELISPAENKRTR